MSIFGLLNGLQYGPVSHFYIALFFNVLGLIVGGILVYSQKNSAKESELLLWVGVVLLAVSTVVGIRLGDAYLSATSNPLSTW